MAALGRLAGLGVGLALAGSVINSTLYNGERERGEHFVLISTFITIKTLKYFANCSVQILVQKNIF